MLATVRYRACLPILLLYLGGLFAAIRQWSRLDAPDRTWQLLLSKIWFSAAASIVLLLVLLTTRPLP